MQLTAKTRTTLGKKNKYLRMNNELPGVIYSKDIGSISVTFPIGNFKKVYETSGRSTIIDISLDNEKSLKGLIEEIQVNPRKNEYSHVSVRAVNLNEEITAFVAFELFGESQAVKIDKGILLNITNEIEIRCLPEKLPQSIKVDISPLEKIGNTISINSIQLPEGVSLVHQGDINLIIASVIAPKEDIAKSNQADTTTTATTTGSTEK